MSRADRSRPCARYCSLSAFYAADSRRVDSKESDVGLWWREGADGPLHRAAWIADTGELYLVRLAAMERSGGEVEVLAIIEDRGELDRVMEGWRAQCGEPGSLAWLRARADKLGGQARAIPLKAAGIASTLALAAAYAIEFA